VESVALYQSGLSAGKVAERMGVSRQAMHDLLKRRIQLRDRVAALPRKDPTAVRRKRAATLKRYRSRAARITRAQIRAVVERDKTCRICGGEGTDVDHILPVAQGGQTDMENLQLLCNPCHIQKSRADRRGVVPLEASSTSSESMSSVEASRERARTSQSPDAAKGSTGHARVFGASTPDSLAFYDPATSSWRTFETSLLATADDGSEEFLETWPSSGMTRNGVSYRLLTPGHPTSASGSGLLPTPTAADSDRGSLTYMRGNPTLKGAAQTWGTPTASEHTGAGHSTKGGKNLRTVVSERWRTPGATDSTKAGQTTHLRDQVGAGSLNPTWVSKLMGFPADWLDL
jgi:5-methylcytosine-specific restriction endonuclease McrA